MSYDIISEFRVSAARRTDFEKAYESNGLRAEVFQKSVGFIEVKLFQTPEQNGTYLVISRWKSQAAFDDFHQDFAAEYEALNARLEDLVTTETCIGTFLHLREVYGLKRGF